MKTKRLFLLPLLMGMASFLFTGCSKPSDTRPAPLISGIDWKTQVGLPLYWTVTSVDYQTDPNNRQVTQTGIVDTSTLDQTQHALSVLIINFLIGTKAQFYHASTIELPYYQYGYTIDSSNDITLIDGKNIVGVLVIDPTSTTSLLKLYCAFPAPLTVFLKNGTTLTAYGLTMNLVAYIGT